MAERMNREALRRNITAGTMAGLGLLLGFFIQDRIDVAGDLHRRRTDAEIDAEVQKSTRQLYEAADAAGKYVLAYLVPESSSKSVRVGTLEGGNGILGKLDTFVRGDNLAELTHEVGQTCLTETRYDTLHPEWIQRGEPDAKPAELVEFGEVIVIQPSDKQYPPIQFRYDADTISLVPLDETTELVLLGNYCDPPT